ncbi:MAG: tRNA lysidine(34) synthetase TilS [Buchnera aphidicola (Periphyllus lyropictus)]|uniref:tRNA lysidine(34) synthetase TilS n=1 Tax=Buchnera aphidicola TaxID=9 RepID=UPI001EC76FF0|nr:tRNA lysidine(34) synthetase TilS [Buchnera aphidicola]NIH16717.1 tRNA lysidine(34) synthetase TilS [Buchnera aphidicola (Periphyllus lyropictus)]USS94622.1 tRNA lysidine(34) synthetase TilS [Buchnera aphidicola (Periphyllus lyropictus)]
MININKITKKYKKFLIAYSGGIDSTVLLYKLIEIRKKYNIKIRAIHINHQLNKKSKKWSKHCKKICKINNIPFILKKIKINKPNLNTESKARKKRYKVFKKKLVKNEILLTGHNLNDQCETFFLAIKRGSGTTGLSGIAYKKKFYKNYLLRPLLKYSRKKIETWAKKRKLKWIEDKSNYNTSYDRNFIRHKIFPKITKRWNFFLKNCFRSIKLINSENKIINKFINPIIKKNLFLDKTLNIKKIKKMDIKIIYIIIRKWINIQGGKMPSLKFLKNILNTVIYKKKKKNPKIQLKKYEIWNYQDRLYWIKKKPKMKNYIIFWKYPFKKLKLPKNFGTLEIKNKKYTKKNFYIKKPKKSQIITIKFQTKKKIRIKNKKKKIKKIYNELKIPPWKRKTTPLLFYNKKFISAIGLFVTKKKYNKKEKNISIIWKKNIS